MAMDRSPWGDTPPRGGRRDPGPSICGHDSHNFSIESLGSEFVTLSVGPKKKKMSVHKKLLCDASDFFAKAFNGQFIEGSTGVMELPEEDEVTLNSFVTWLYRGSLPNFTNLFGSHDHPDDVEVALRSFVDCHFLPLIAFGEKICCDKFNNSLMDAIQAFFRSLYENGGSGGMTPAFTGRQICKLYECTTEGNKARVLCVAITAFTLNYYTSKANISVLIDETHDQPDFFKDMLYFDVQHRARLAEGMSPLNQFGVWAPRGAPCLFHTHAEGEFCYLKAQEAAFSRFSPWSDPGDLYD